MYSRLHAGGRLTFGCDQDGLRFSGCQILPSTSRVSRLPLTRSGCMTLVPVWVMFQRSHSCVAVDAFGRSSSRMSISPLVPIGSDRHGGFG